MAISVRTQPRPALPVPPGTGTGMLGVVILASALPILTSLAVAEWTSHGVYARFDRLSMTILTQPSLVAQSERNRAAKRKNRSEDGGRDGRR